MWILSEVISLEIKQEESAEKFSENIVLFVPRTS